MIVGGIGAEEVDEVRAEPGRCSCRWKRPSPIAAFIAPVEGEWQRRAALSTLLVPIRRAAFCAT
jgi:hypothetical protein